MSFSPPSDKAMVPFVSVENMMHLIHHVGIEKFLCELTDVIEDDFRRWESFDKTPRIASHSRQGVIELMPTSDGAVYSFKYVNGHPRNTIEGLQTVTAFGLLAEVSTGYPVLISEMTMLTALRTAATSAMAARNLAPSGARTMAIIGNGAQAEFQALAMKAVCGIETIKLYDIDPRATEKTRRNLAGSGLEVIGCCSPQAAIERAEIITTCTADKQFATILTDNMIGAGIHINAIGGDCPGKTELHRDILLRSDTFVEFAPQTRIEGEIQQMPADFPVTELWRVVSGEAAGRCNPQQITLFDSVGFAIEDFSALRFVRARLAGTDLCQNLDIIADPDDPRDLFGMLQRCRQ
ncbi:ornithine cyclodeaminase [Phyllobacterium endophyticum]|uniref:Ornithine cyclodeaminase n=1 Tax=Phyllobacterium endophyticum TaxID=1149773 RepID=A0A2P7ASN6_9HYPH|nr:ornithine cyclodeaminase [Phyllobacterium endophyticum]PSH57235.1 ornithine cyclodeaminase [Phyllobacterium endophyticum]TYR44526.1 ornithine cyclodeaminase [Phyllobacterium endophyticum]